MDRTWWCSTPWGIFVPANLMSLILRHQYPPPSAFPFPSLLPLPPFSHQLRHPLLNQLPNSLPPDHIHIPLAPLDSRVLVSAPPADLCVAQQPYEDGRLRVRAVDHARVAGAVV